MSDPVPTGCGPVDDLLGGGFERGTVSQVYGPPGSGKTNLVLSAAVETAAAGGRALFVDTEGLSVERFEQVAAARADDPGVAAEPTSAGRVDDDRPTAGDGTAAGDGDDGTASRDDDRTAAADDDRTAATDGSSTAGGTGTWADAAADDDPPGGVPADLDAIAGRIVVEEAHDFESQEEAVRDAAAFAPRADLVVLDSATGFYRLERVDEPEEGDSLRRVARQVTHLLSLARKHDLAVAVTNQVYTDPDTDSVRPLGGHTLAHWTGTVLRVDRFRGGKRRATLEKHRSLATGGTATFRITGGGVGGVEDPAGP